MYCSNQSLRQETRFVTKEEKINIEAHSNYVTLRFKSVYWVEWLYLVLGAWTLRAHMLIKVQPGDLGATLALFYVRRRKKWITEDGAFIRVGGNAEERIEADYNTVEEGRGRKFNRFSYGHLYAMRRVGLQRLEKKIGMRLIVNTVKCLIKIFLSKRKEQR